MTKTELRGESTGDSRDVDSLDHELKEMAVAPKVLLAKQKRRVQKRIV